MPKSVLFNRDEVLRRVTQLFWTKGYNGTSMQDLVDVTGLNRSSIYNSFGDKHNLYEESLRFYQHLQQQRLSGYLDKSESPKKRIKNLFEGVYHDIVNQKDVKGCFMSNCTTELANTDPDVQVFLLRNKETMMQMFIELIQEGQELGEIGSTKNPHELAAFLFSSLQGLRVTGMLENKSSEIRGIIDQTLAVL